MDCVQPNSSTETSIFPFRAATFILFYWSTILAIGNTSFLTASTPAALAWCRDTFGFSFGSVAPIIASASQIREQLHVLKVFLRSVPDVNVYVSIRGNVFSLSKV